MDCFQRCIRNSRSQMFFKIGVLKISQENTCSGVSKSLRILFIQNTYGGCFCKIVQAKIIVQGVNTSELKIVQSKIIVQEYFDKNKN